MNAKDRPDIFRQGERFRGYVIDRLLGKGGIGAVYLVRHEMLDTLFALKALYPDVAAQNDEFVKRFVREAKLASRIRHPNLIAVHDAGIDEPRNLYYLVMDYVVGGTVRQMIAINRTIEVGQAMSIVAQVASALEAAQKYHVVHRDIKPENIMIAPDGSAKLVDLGVAKVEDGRDSLKTAAKTVFGTPAYVSPEQALDSSKVDCRADIYSLGVVLYEMLTGVRPFRGNNATEILTQLLSDDPVADVRDLDPNIPDGVAEMVNRMCAKNPDERIASPADLLSQLAVLGYLSIEPPSAEYATEESKPIPIDLNAPAPENQSTFITTDAEIVDFLKKRKSDKIKKRVKQIMTALAALFLLMALTHLALSIWH